MNTEGLKLVRSALIDADHLAEVAERLLGALNEVAGAQERFDATGTATDASKLAHAEEVCSDYWRATQSAVYEYRKRAERARAAMVPNDRVEGRDAASSRRVPSHDGLAGND